MNSDSITSAAGEQKDSGSAGNPKDLPILEPNPNRKPKGN